MESGPWSWHPTPWYPLSIVKLQQLMKIMLQPNKNILVHYLQMSGGDLTWTHNLQVKVSATVRLFGGDSSHTPFFGWQSFQENILYPLAIIHMEHINVLDFDDKSERNLCFSFGNLGIIFNGVSVQLFPPSEKWLFGWVRGHPPANGGRD